LVAASADHPSGNGNGIQQIAEWWHEAEVAVRAAQLSRARRFLRWILACSPDDEEAWLWLARLSTSQRARLSYLRQAYVFHPNSVRVQAALREARSDQLEMAVGDLKPGRAVLRCFPNERYLEGEAIGVKDNGHDPQSSPEWPSLRNFRLSKVLPSLLE
jgi:hypothetical protein